MPRRKKQWWKPRIKSDSLQSIFSILTILFGILLSIAQFGALLGAANFFHDFSVYLFGISAFFLPLVLIILGLNLTRFKSTIAQPRSLWASVLFFLGTILFLGSASSTGGGWLGNEVARVISTYITRLGGVITGLTVIIIGILMGFNLSLHEVGEKLSPLASFFKFISQSIRGFRKTTEKEPQTVDNTAKDDKKIGPIFPELETKTDSDTKSSAVIEIIDDQTTSTKSSTQSQHTAVNPASDHSTSPSEVVVSKPYVPPPLTILEEKEKTVTDQGLVQKNAQTIEATLGNFGIQARIAEVNLGPAVTQYAINLAEGTRSSKITSLQNDLALALASPTGSVRIESPIPGKRLIGIEVPNMQLTAVRLKEMLTSPQMQNDPSKLAVALGEDVSGRPVVAHIDKWPHILVAGSTGSGKSIMVHSVIASILFRATPEEVRFIMVDPKRVELTQYNNLPHLQTPVIFDADRTVAAFKWAVQEMERRYKLFQQLGARNLDDFNKVTDTERLPYVVIIVDELADLMMYAGNEMEALITRIAQKARATGIHMLLSTQRPSVDVITGLIKANIPSRIALNVSSSTDSRVILDGIGAEKLLGKGDMLYLPPDAGKPKRIQGVFLSNQEIARIAEYMEQFEPGYKVLSQSVATTSQNEQSNPSLQPTSIGSDPISAYTQQMTDQSDDNKFIDAVSVILNHDKASASLLQRRLKIGYARAARLLDELEEKQLIGPPDGSNPREVYLEKAKLFLEKAGGSSNESPDNNDSF